mgnify:CR=1 FL=1
MRILRNPFIAVALVVAADLAAIIGVLTIAQ